MFAFGTMSHASFFTSAEVKKQLKFKKKRVFKKEAVRPVAKAREACFPDEAVITGALCRQLT